MISLCRHSKLSSEQILPSPSTLAECWSFVSLEKANFYVGKHFNQTHSLFFLYPVWSPLPHSLWDQFIPTCTLFLLLLRSLACMVALPSLPNGDFLWNSFTCVFSALPFLLDCGLRYTMNFTLLPPENVHMQNASVHPVLLCQCWPFLHSFQDQLSPHKVFYILLLPSHSFGIALLS